MNAVAVNPTCPDKYKYIYADMNNALANIINFHLPPALVDNRYHFYDSQSLSSRDDLLRNLVIESLMICNIRKGGWDAIPYTVFCEELSRIFGGHSACALDYYKNHSVKDDISVFDVGDIQFLVFRPDTLRRVLA